MEKRILVVDDEEIFRKALETLFVRAGYSVQCAGSAEEALAVVEKESFLVIFLDLFLPKMDGVELCRRLRERFPQAVIYAVTGHAVRYESEDCRQAGFTRCLAKPVNIAELLKAAAEGFGGA